MMICEANEDTNHVCAELSERQIASVCFGPKAVKAPSDIKPMSSVAAVDLLASGSDGKTHWTKTDGFNVGIRMS